MKKLALFFIATSFVVSSMISPVFAGDSSLDGDIDGPAPESSAGYLPYDEFMELYAGDFTVYGAVQSSPTSPVKASDRSGLSAILLSMFGDYSPIVTQYRYQSNTSTNYTYVNDIQPDYIWLCSAAIFAIVLFCVFKLGGTLFCRT